MAPAAILPVAPGDYVLDLCAAPGGKATELGARLKGQGMLVANEISASRAKALLRNIELCGIKNSFITNEVPKNLARVMPEFFDKVLVDAPCSGEGMFRKDMDVAKTWDESRPEFFANLQREIVSNAISMLNQVDSCCIPPAPLRQSKMKEQFRISLKIFRRWNFWKFRLMKDSQREIQNGEMETTPLKKMCAYFPA